MFKTLKTALKIPEVRKSIITVLLLILVYRIFAHIPLPGIDNESLKSLFSSNQLLGLVNLFSGGSLSRFSVATVGLGPYITSSIIMQMLVSIVPSLEELSKEGMYGYEKINKYTKFLTLPIALLQSFGIYFLFSRQGLFKSHTPFDLIVTIITLMAGSFILMWLGDLITEQNIGQGISILILASILSGLPSSFQSFLLALESGNFFNIIFFVLMAGFVVGGVVLVDLAVRKIEIAYASSSTASHQYQGSSFLPLKVNQAGVIPIIFAVSLVLLPSFIGNYLTQLGGTPSQIGYFLIDNFQTSSFLYNVFYFMLVVIFTFFYTAFTFNPEKIAEDLKSRGGFIPGIRPGKATAKYLNRILTRITLIGAVFLGLIAILPNIVSSFLNISSLAIGGTGVLIVVSVIIESIRQIEAQVVMREYDKISTNY